ncbi:hypothetical protein HB779_09785 [Phyllobacterium sp. 628]|uniref:hypothetical protein n=1 Tax=Phyllobacterium sp. 628 TaxID=2718938 RepID=UPI00166248ED|nr:hypothetical protein [Phyllobacterium sp. 628]QND52168.1 hypothetical protein HB779_09785 [Phyllobacterium sp. 628]
MLVIAIAAAWRRGLKAIVGWQPLAKRVAIVAALATLLISSATLAAHHYEHYAARAQIHDRSVLAEILAQPICTTRSPDAHASGLASTAQAPTIR